MDKTIEKFKEELDVILELLKEAGDIPKIQCVLRILAYFRDDGFSDALDSVVAIQHVLHHESIVEEYISTVCLEKDLFTMYESMLSKSTFYIELAERIEKLQEELLKK
jgi:hypothetical protein